MTYQTMQKKNMKETHTNLYMTFHSGFQETIPSETIHKIGSVAGARLGRKKTIHIVGDSVHDIFGNITDSTHQPFSFILKRLVVISSR